MCDDVCEMKAELRSVTCHPSDSRAKRASEETGKVQVQSKHKSLLTTANGAVGRMTQILKACTGSENSDVNEGKINQSGTLN